MWRVECTRGEHYRFKAFKGREKEALARAWAAEQKRAGYDVRVTWVEPS